MKKILSILLMLFILGNICYAQDVRKDFNSNPHYVGTNTVQYCSRGHHHDKHNKEFRHNRGDGRDRDARCDQDDRDDDHIDAGDVITGIVIYEVIKEILD